MESLRGPILPSSVLVSGGTDARRSVPFVRPLPRGAGLHCWSGRQSRFVLRMLPSPERPAEGVWRGLFEVPFERRSGRDEFRNQAEGRLSANQNGSDLERKQSARLRRGGWDGLYCAHRATTVLFVGALRARRSSQPPRLTPAPRRSQSHAAPTRFGAEDGRF